MFHVVLALTKCNTNSLDFADPLTADSFYAVYDTMGRLLFQRPLHAGQECEEIDLSRFGRGTYVVRITGKDGVSNERVVVR
ncbi:MAG TPA: T9SS type A sorting domain-containing protein [Flavobacteriales bacterium]|nr:T9SS type A sorting domain-containing protein [Flavobacteriales bacterium]